MKKIYYVSYYDIPENAEQNRNYVVSAATKSEYICKTIARLGYDVTIVSASATMSSRFCKGMDVDICENLHLHLFDSLPSGNVLRRVKSRLNIKKQIKNYLTNNVKYDDVLIVYHSLGYMDVVARFKRKTDVNLIIEAEEIYGDVINNPKTSKKEIKFFNLADKFIFSTELLNEKLNNAQKPYSVIYGTYHVEPDKKFKFSDDKIHVVYAGTLDYRKGGAMAAVSVAETLDFNYHIHIIGFGNEKDKKNLQDCIDEITKKAGAQVTYDGLLSGEEYIRFIQSCDIGLSTQMPDAQFNDTSFPSKVLSYLANGLRVVSIKIKAIEKSKILDLLYLYEDNTPRAISEAIKSIDFNDNYDSRKRIKELDEMFAKELKKLMEDEL